MDMGLGGLWELVTGVVLRVMGLLRVGHDCVTELNWTEATRRSSGARPGPDP